MTQAPKREFDLEFPIGKVKLSLNDTNKLPGYRQLNSNRLLNTYRVALVYGLNTAIQTVQVYAVDENKTHCIFEIYNTSGSNLAAPVISEMQEKYLQNFIDLLTGKPE